MKKDKIEIVLDEIFGEDNFKNEIIWHYNKFAGKTTGLPLNHDTILYYTNSDLCIFNKIRVAVDKQRKQTARIWDSVQKKAIQKRDEQGNLIYYDQTDKTIDDTWIDIPLVNPMAKERTEIDYSTMKPVALLERIVTLSSNKGAVVADFFGGSGVTATVANKLNRKFITCDIGSNSVQTMRDRLKADGAQFDVLEIKDGVSLYRNPVQTMDKIKSLIPGLKNEDSLDAFWEGAISDSKLGMIPVYVPNLMDSSTKLLDEVLMNRILHKAIPELDPSVKKVIVYYVDITDKAVIEKFIRDDDSTLVQIELRDLKEILDDVVVDDYAEFTCVRQEDGFVITLEKFVSDRLTQKINEFNQKAEANSKKKAFHPIVISDNGLELIEWLSVDCTSVDGEWHSDSEIKIDKNGYISVNGTKTKDFWNATIKSEKKPLRLKIRNICGDETVWKV